MNLRESNPSFRFIDLFAGLGGFHLSAAADGGKCVLACEIDEALISNYERNFGITPFRDIRDIDPTAVPDHDLLCAGFPCQPFSKAGNQLGRKDTQRGTVIDKVIEILRVKRPEFFILENVAHFVRHDSGNTYRRVKDAIEAFGYATDYEQFSPHRFGIPQIRERIYMVGRMGSLKDFMWPVPHTIDRELRLTSVLDTNPPEARKLTKQVVDCLKVWQEFLTLYPEGHPLPSFPIWSMEFKATYPYDKDSLSRVDLERLRKAKGCFGKPLARKNRGSIAELVPSYARGTKAVFPKWKQDFIRQNRELYARNRAWIDEWLPKIQTFPPSLQKLEWNCGTEERDIWKYVIQFRASGVRIKRPTTSPSLVAMTTTQVPIIGWEKRYMTVRECARLQSMDELIIDLPETAAMKALGNAVNVKVVSLILERLLALREVGHTSTEVSDLSRYSVRPTGSFGPIASE